MDFTLQLGLRCVFLVFGDLAGDETLFGLFGRCFVNRAVGAFSGW
jgi:hypothetical protein